MRDTGTVRSREAILEATRAVIGRAGFAGVTIAAVAKEAQVSRQTVYSNFGTREDLVSQAVTERLTMLTGAFAEVLESTRTPLELIVEIVLASRHRILEDPLLRALTLGGGSNPIFDPGAAERARDYAVMLLSPAAERFPELTDRLELVADIGIHVGWSVLCLDSPDARSDPDLRRFLTTWLSPLMATLDRAGASTTVTTSEGPAGPAADAAP